jgi:ApeA N-terminal domain 1
VLRKTCEETGQHTHRVTFVEGDWEIIVDQLMSSAQSFKDMKKDGGYSITHVGRIQRKDNASFSRNDASKIIDVFSIFLSFLKGSRVSTILLVGYDKQNNKICEEWDGNLSGHPYQNTISWMPNNMLVDLPTIFPNFVSWWNDWGQSATLILNLYLEANYNNLMDVSIVFSCSTLEMLARFILVEERKKITESKFRNTTMAKKIASLLNEFSIPVDFPPSRDDSIDNLIRFVTDNGDILVDPQPIPKALLVFTRIRNEMIHSKKTYKDKLSPAILFEVASLGLWYIEMTILARLDYKGVYRNRLNRNRWDEGSRQYDDVPWYKPEE